MATLYKPDGTKEEVNPKNDRDFQLEELYALVDCRMVEIVPVSPTEFLVVDEEGKLGHPKPINHEATKIFKRMQRLPGDYIAGNALLCGKDEVR